LSPEKRDAINTVYAFCRKTDDIVDEGNESDEIKYQKLHKWRIELEKAFKGQSEFPLLNKLAQIINHFNIPLDPFFELIKGMEMDLQRKRYISFEDLIEYCYRVASTVGLMSIEIFGYKNKSTKDYAVNLGLALQLTNILRDVKTDSEMGRIYLPNNDLQTFGYSENDLISGLYNEKFVELMAHQAGRAKNYFDKANRSLDFDDKPTMFAARAMQHIYFSLLKKLEANNFNIFENRIAVSTPKKVAISVGVWAKYSLVY